MVIHATLMILTLLFGLLSVELRELLHAVLSFCAMCVTIACLYWLLSAPYVAVFQLLIYAGAVVALFIAAIMLTRRR